MHRPHASRQEFVAAHFLGGAHAQRRALGLITSSARLVAKLLHRAGLPQVRVLMHMICAAQAACQPERWRAGALSGRAHTQWRTPASYTSGTRLASRLPRRASLAQVTVVIHMSCAAQAAREPERGQGGGALSGRRSWHGYVGRSACRAAAAALRAWAGECSDASELHRASRMPAGASLGGALLGGAHDRVRYRGIGYRLG